MKCIHGFKYKDECARCLGLKKSKEKNDCPMDTVTEIEFNEIRFLKAKKGFSDHDPYPRVKDEKEMP